MSNVYNALSSKVDYFFKLMPSSKFALAFIAKIFTFSVIYWVIFSLNPDSFRFADGFNSKPFERFQIDVLTLDEPNVSSAFGFNISLEQFKNQMVEFDKLHQSNVALSAAEKSQEYIYLELTEVDQSRLFKNPKSQPLEYHLKLYSTLYAALDEDRAKEMDAYKEEFITPLYSRLEPLLSSGVKPLTSRGPMGKKPRARLLDYIVKQGILEEIKRHYSYLINSYSKFSEPSHQAKMILEKLKLIQIQERIQTENSRYREKKAEVISSFEKARSESLSQIGFIDFLYFSACTSTTTPFGDITANSNWTRLLIILQIFAGIVILALLIQNITSQKVALGQIK